MRTLFCTLWMAIAASIPAQRDGVTEYGKPCGEIHATASPAKVGRDLRLFVNIGTRALTGRHALLGIGFSERNLYVSGPQRRACRLLIEPAMIVPVPLRYRVPLLSLVGDTVVLRNIQSTMIGLRLYFQSVFVDGFTAYWSNGVRVEVIP